MRDIGKRFTALAVLIGVLPTQALAQTSTPLCRDRAEPDPNTIINDTLVQRASDGVILLDRRIALFPVSTLPAGAAVGVTAGDPFILLRLEFGAETVSVIEDVYAYGFDTSLTYVSPYVDGIGWTGVSEYPDGVSYPTRVGQLGDGLGKDASGIGTSDKGIRSALVLYNSEERASLLLEPGDTLELKVASIPRIDSSFGGSIEDRDKARHNRDIKEAFPYFTTTVTYDRQAQYEATRLENGPALDLIKKFEAGECAPEERECFLTTASCDVIGLADDCWELRTLRRFRDDWLAKQTGGPEDIARYYREAPAIASALRHDPSLAIQEYWGFILPSALAAAMGANRLARRLYTRGMVRLSHRSSMHRFAG